MRHILGRQASSWSAAVLLLAGGCAAPCIDDGFVFKQGSDCANSMSATTSAGPGSSQASDPTLATTSASATQGSGSESGASASMSATDSATDTGVGPSCSNGVQDGDETDVDCGGSCGPTCENGEDCAVNGDCVDDNCSPLEICAAPECTITMDDNSCQACIKASCCDTVTECLADMKCACWLECIKMNNDFDPCKTQCNINGNPGPVTACANSKCNTPDACAL